VVLYVVGLRLVIDTGVVDILESDVAVEGVLLEAFRGSTRNPSCDVNRVSQSWYSSYDPVPLDPFT
jgi:hypothetical protein